MVLFEKKKKQLKSSNVSFTELFLMFQTQAHVEDGDNSSSGVSSDQEVPGVPVDETTRKNENNNIHHLPHQNSTTQMQQQAHVQVQQQQQGTIHPQLKQPLPQKIIHVQVQQNQHQQHYQPPTQQQLQQQQQQHYQHQHHHMHHVHLHHHQLQQHQQLDTIKEQNQQQVHCPASNKRMNHHILTRHAVSLAQLPPPLEADAEEQSSDLFVPPPPEFNANGTAIAPGANGTPEIVFAPPPQFSDNKQQHRVKIIGAIPKTVTTVTTGTKVKPPSGRLHSQ